MDMVERVARAMCDERWGPGAFDTPTEGGGFSQEAKEQFRNEARAALAAMREPTEKMVRAGIGALAVADYGMPEYGPEDAAEMTFSAMIDAALTSSEKPTPSLE